MRGLLSIMTGRYMKYVHKGQGVPQKGIAKQIETAKGGACLLGKQGPIFSEHSPTPEVSLKDAISQDEAIKQDLEKLRNEIKELKSQLKCSAPAVSKQTPSLVVNAFVYANGDTYFQCPNCKVTMEREYQRYCDRCGQRLKWPALRKIHYIYL